MHCMMAVCEWVNVEIALSDHLATYIAESRSVFEGPWHFIHLLSIIQLQALRNREELRLLDRWHKTACQIAPGGWELHMREPCRGLLSGVRFQLHLHVVLFVDGLPLLLIHFRCGIVVEEDGLYHIFGLYFNGQWFIHHFCLMGDCRCFGGAWAALNDDGHNNFWWRRWGRKSQHCVKSLIDWLKIIVVWFFRCSFIVLIWTFVDKIDLCESKTIIVNTNRILIYRNSILFKFFIS